MLKTLVAGLTLLFGLALLPAWAAQDDPENLIYMDVGDTTGIYGRVVIRLLADNAPNHVARIKELTREGFYNGVVFHRVFPDFMAQTGDPTGTGFGSSDKPDLKAEFSSMPHLRGMVSMARGDGDDDSANSQFFIVLNDSRNLDYQYTIWGEVIGGMEFVDRIKKGDPEQDGAVEGWPDRIYKMQVAADATD